MTTITLSPRQRQALEFVAEGLPRKQAMERLGIAEGSLKMHLQVAYRKLGATCDAQAVATAFRLGLLK